MITLKNFVDEVRAICTAHPQLRVNYYGDNIQLDDKSQSLYPAVVIEPQPSTLGKGNIEYTIGITVLDLMKDDRSQDLEIDSKTLEILTDIIGDLKLGDNTREDYFVQDDIVVSPIQPAPDFNDRLLGWSAEIVAIVSYAKSGCSTNIINSNRGIGTMSIESTFTIA